MEASVVALASSIAVLLINLHRGATMRHALIAAARDGFAIFCGTAALLAATFLGIVLWTSRTRDR
ncbi:MAG: hypothetical protein JO250_22395 [Armatimonadetes bacterium]|nr:hypothetical protein [Armatimonadota bacterium]